MKHYRWGQSLTVRFYEQRSYKCPECYADLMWGQVKMFGELRLTLQHGIHGCARDNKRFYAPGVDLEEITPDIWESSQVKD